MGNSNTQQASFVLDTRSLQDWTKIQEQGFCELWMHKKTQQQLQAYPIPESFARNQEQVRKYNLRKNNSTYLVSVEAIVTPGDSFLCSEPRTAYALVENIPSRLKHYKHSLTFQQTLYVLAASASGYNTLNSFFGPIEPHQDMICFNQQGKIKVWLNQNLSLNQPSKTARSSYPPSDDYNLAQRRTKEGVDKLIKIVEQATIEGFSPQFSEQCKKLGTYFEIVNMVPFYCEKTGIELPDKVLLPRVLENPTFPQREMTKDYSMPSLHHINSQNLDISRVKTVLFSSSQVFQPPMRSVIVPRAFQNPNPIKIQMNPISSRPAQHSPKITFSIRASLPVPASTPISPIKAITRERLPPQPQRRAQLQPEIFLGHRTDITPPCQNVIMEKVERKGSRASQQAKNTEQPSQQRKQAHTEVTFHKLEMNQTEKQSKPVEDATNQKQGSICIGEEKKEYYLDGEQDQLAGTGTFRQEQQESAYQQLQQSYSEENNMSGPQSRLQNELSSGHSEPSIPQPPQRNHLEQIIHSSQQLNNEDIRQDYSHLYHQEQICRQVVTSELEVPSYKTSQQNIQVEPVEKLDFVKDSYSSQHSQAEVYVPPAHYNMHSPIIQQQEENFSSPRRGNSEIEEWQAKLNKFTNSKYSQNVEKKKISHEPQPDHYVQKHEFQQNSYKIFHEQQRNPYRSERSEKEPYIYVSQPPQAPRESQVNELANLQVEDIEEYIRAKYNLDKKSYQNTNQREYSEMPITRIQSYYEKVNKNSFTYQNVPLQASNDDIYNREYEYSYKFGKNEHSYEPSSYVPSFKEPKSQEISFKDFYNSSNNNDYEYDRENYYVQPYEKQNYKPINYYNELYQPSDRVSIQLSQDTGTYRTSVPSFVPEEKKGKQDIERNRQRVSESAKFQERYKKYVVNAPRARVSNKFSRISNQKQLSLILSGDDKDISGISPKPLASELNESSKRGINDFIVGDQSSKPQTVTYQKLRTLLWQD